MLQLKKRDFATIVKKLKERCDVEGRHTGDWQIRIFYRDKLIAGTKCSEGKGGIPPIIVQKIKKQLHLASDKEFTDFKNCPLSCEQYIGLLKSRNII